MKILTIILAFWAAQALPCITESVSGTDLRTGKSVVIDPKSNKVSVFVFLSAKCPCSKSHEETLAKLAKDFPEVVFAGVNSNADEEESLVTEHFRNSEMKFPVIRDKDAKIASLFGALKTPHAFIVGPAGQCWFNGGVDDTKDATKASKHYLREALNDLQKGKEPKEKTVRTLGCIIKRS